MNLQLTGTKMQSYCETPNNLLLDIASLETLKIIFTCVIFCGALKHIPKIFQKIKNHAI